jgi:hypothetical protein
VENQAGRGTTPRQHRQARELLQGQQVTNGKPSHGFGSTGLE